ncbi:A/G-specific adenine glycosylase [Methylocapsa aurea]|uniref:A/G-specific adenine glycosylase n=1 Tax=Methylocapsa aurea TaxID=663610 RepID=UPI000569BABA|nr:A/G-specific adenine glycosylase [Methylocapsa aurea]
MYDALQAPLIAQRRASTAVLDWYDRHRRVLPWRALPGRPADPYVVWLSEIMLQQTTVAAVKPYFTGFLARWPTVGLLADAPVDEVMRQWAGLGYYSRARNLHACAKMIAADLNGAFPDSEAGLLALPGIGPYTAAAIAAIAFGRRAVVVDGNVERVIARFFAIAEPLPAAKPAIRERAGELTPSERPGDFAQAMMDLGATICTPRQPACAICPLLTGCESRAAGSPEDFPRKRKKPPKPLRRGAAFYVRREDGAVLVRTRAPKGLLGGMVEIPGTAWEAEFDPERAAMQAPIEAPYRKLGAEVEHVFTHFALRLEIYVAEVGQGQEAPAGCRWAAARDLADEALPSVMRKVVEAARRSGGPAKPT